MSTAAGIAPEMGAEKIDIAHLRNWIGRTAREVDYATAGALAGLAALLDHAEPPWNPGELPPLGHWLYFLPRALQSCLDQDGHPRRGGFLPPVPLPRRMWAGSTVRFHSRIPLDAPIERRSSIADITQKTGGSGELAFVTVLHEVFANGALAVSERQDIVYRDAAPAPAAAAGTGPALSVRSGEQRRRLVPDASQLFRFSALTFNAHRIHYDHAYARGEGYEGLVVHGPYIAILLMDLALRGNRGRAVSGFTFRGLRPLIGNAPCDLCGRSDDGGVDLWCRDAAGQETMTARLTWE